MSADSPARSFPAWPPHAWPPGVGRVVLEKIDSTNAEAGRRAALGEAGPVWLLAHRQTAGRGRRGRAWADPAGNFAATLLYRPDCAPAEVALRGFVAGLALHDALSGVAGPALADRLRLKWPNDLLLDGGKLSGILLEGGPGGRLLVGIGVNLAATPPADPDAAFAPVSWQGAGLPPLRPESLLDRLGPAFAAWERRLTGEGFAPLRAAWLARAAGVGRPLVARLQAGDRHGVFETIDSGGALVLRGDDGTTMAISAADIHFPCQPA